MVTIVDYGVGNLSSIQNMFKKIGIEVAITSNSHLIEKAEKIILPGVGAFDTCMTKLNESGLQPVLSKMVLQKKTPILGVCVGLQMLFEKSEEGLLPGLGWIKGTVVRFQRERMDKDLKIPHMGWTEVAKAKPSRLLEGADEEQRFYFVHSFHAHPKNTADILLVANYGYQFTAAVERENIIGVQFHPEKSHRFGMKLLENFAKYY